MCCSPGAYVKTWISPSSTGSLMSEKSIFHLHRMATCSTPFVCLIHFSISSNIMLYSWLQHDWMRIQGSACSSCSPGAERPQSDWGRSFLGSSPKARKTMIRKRQYLHVPTKYKGECITYNYPARNRASQHLNPVFWAFPGLHQEAISHGPWLPLYQM